MQLLFYSGIIVFLTNVKSVGSMLLMTVKCNQLNVVGYSCHVFKILFFINSRWLTKLTFKVRTYLGINVMS